MHSDYDYAENVAQGRHVGDGWRPMVLELIELCKKHDVRIYQIKEKFGGLRFYSSVAPGGLEQLIWAAEHISFHICEDCGSSGKQRSTSWIRTLCDECFKKRNPDEDDQ